MGITTKFENTQKHITKKEFLLKMKISAVLIATAAANDRKVPPRTPAQRLNTLHRFMREWVQIEIAGTINRPSRAANMIENGVARIEAKMSEAAAKDCFFFDPSLPHGGPAPKDRKRRSSDWAEAELSRIQRDVDDNDELDFFDRYFSIQSKTSQERGLGASGDVEVPSMDAQFQERLSSEPNLAWKQIGTGFRKWILRYISECYGQRTYSYHTGRLERIHSRIKTAYDEVGADQFDGDYGEDSY